MEFSRTTYLNKLIASQGTDQIKIITGIRRCGKSYLLNTIFKNHLLNTGTPNKNIIEMNLDGYSSRQYRNPDNFLKHITQQINHIRNQNPQTPTTNNTNHNTTHIHTNLNTNPPHNTSPHPTNQTNQTKTIYLLLDEIQLLQHFPEVLNDLIRLPHVDIYATGSNAHMLSKDIVTEFRGRAENITLRPLSFSEFMEQPNQTTPNSFTEYATYGGLPAAVLRTNNEHKIEYLTQIITETYITDIIERNQINHPGDLLDTFDVLSSNIGGLTNPNKIANTFTSTKHTKISPRTIERYLEYLQDSFLFEKAIRYDIKGRKYIGSNAKYYATDLGLRNAQLNFRQLEQTHIMENIIYNELRARGYGVDIGTIPTQQKNRNGKYQRVQYEIDFICNKGSKRYYIQSAYAIPTPEKLEQEQKAFTKLEDGFKRIIITKEGPEPHYNKQGVLLINIYDFLLDTKTLEF